MKAGALAPRTGPALSCCVRPGDAYFAMATQSSGTPHQVPRTSSVAIVFHKLSNHAADCATNN